MLVLLSADEFGVCDEFEVDTLSACASAFDGALDGASCFGSEDSGAGVGAEGEGESEDEEDDDATAVSRGSVIGVMASPN